MIASSQPGSATRTGQRPTPALEVDRGPARAADRRRCSFVGGLARAGEGPAAQAAPDGSGAVATQPAVRPPRRRSARRATRLPAGTLRVFNRPVVTFRSTVLGVPPQDRADSAHNRIIAPLERGGEGRITVDKVGRRQCRQDRRRARVHHLGKRRRAAFGRDARHGHRRRRATRSRQAIAETREARDGAADGRPPRSGPAAPRSSTCFCW